MTSLEPEDEGSLLKKFHLLNELIVQRQKEAMNVVEVIEVITAMQRLRLLQVRIMSPYYFGAIMSVYPKLSVLEENLLVIPATSTQVERVFPEQDTVAHREGEIA